MSTLYYKLRKPITSIKPTVLGEHTRVGIWANHAKTGELVFRNEEWKDAIWLFVEYEGDDSKVPMRTHWGGDKGTVVTIHENLPDEQQLISEYGELLTVLEIKTRQGAKRKDSFPTELFGYENKNGGTA